MRMGDEFITQEKHINESMFFSFDSPKKKNEILINIIKNMNEDEYKTFFVWKEPDKEDYNIIYISTASPVDYNIYEENDLNELIRRIYICGLDEMVVLKNFSKEFVQNFILSMYVAFDFEYSIEDDYLFAGEISDEENEELKIEYNFFNAEETDTFFCEYLPYAREQYLKQYKNIKKKLSFETIFNEIQENPCPGLKVLTKENYEYK